jgi:predicted phage-related endonuclease
MAVTNFPEWDLGTFFGMNIPLRVNRLKRDPELEKMLVEKAKEFWERYVIGNEVPAVDGSDACAKAIEYLYPKDSTIMRDATVEETLKIKELMFARLAVLEAGEKKTKLENELKQAIEEGEGLWSPMGAVTWKKTKDGTNVEWELLANDLMANFNPKIKRDLIGNYTSPKPGHRRFLFKPAP